MDLITKIEKINKQRDYFLNKAQEQFDELMFLSLDGKKSLYDAAYEEFETTLIICWRFDGRLRRARAELSKQESDEALSE